MEKRIGIVGFGFVGRSYADFFIKNKQKLTQHFFGSSHSSASLVVWDQAVMSSDTRKPFEASGVVFLDRLIATMREFVDSCDVVLISPGVDSKKIAGMSHKFFTELDLFPLFFKGRSVAITGTLGKTTVTLLTSSIISSYIKHHVPAIGNIGVPLLTALSHNFSDAVIELSSFQLERNTMFAPDVAVLTNFYPNHLDRHITIQEYVAAKCRLFTAQKEVQVAIIPWDACVGLGSEYLLDVIKRLKSKLIVVMSSEYHHIDYSVIPRDCYKIIGRKNGTIMVVHIEKGAVLYEEALVESVNIPDTTFFENWMMALASSYAFGISPLALQEIDYKQLSVHYPRHRLEHVATVRNVFFYNDSKSTIPEATQAATKKLAQSGKPLYVILGGLGKGVDRTSLVSELQKYSCVKKLYCFGNACSDFPGVSCYKMLDEVLDDLFSCMKPGDQVLFSPSGSSFDLFTNFQHRGDVFKELVLQRISQLKSQER